MRDIGKYWEQYIDNEDPPCSCCDAYPCAVHQREELPAARVVHKLSWWRRLLRLTKSTTLTTYHHNEADFLGRVMSRAYDRELEVSRRQKESKVE